MCMQRFDNAKYTRLQFLRAVCHAVGSDMMISDSQSDADDDDDTEDEEIIRKLQTRMPQLTIHQYTKTKAATIFNAIKITVYSVR